MNNKEVHNKEALVHLDSLCQEVDVQWVSCFASLPFRDVYDKPYR